MSIHNIWDKIKRYPAEGQLTLIYICVVCVVGVGAFGLGRLSVQNTTTIAPVAILGANAGTYEPISDTKPISNNTVSVPGEMKRYVASKNGKLYYSTTCSGAKRIKVENQVWFATEQDAQKSGYTRSTSCK